MAFFAFCFQSETKEGGPRERLFVSPGFNYSEEEQLGMRGKLGRLWAGEPVRCFTYYSQAA